MMISRDLFGWSPPHIQSLTLVSEVFEMLESPSPYLDPGAETSTSHQTPRLKWRRRWRSPRRLSQHKPQGPSPGSLFARIGLIGL
ncbi:hypothetical protein K1719_039858 [Acacia pycnantha]|nr:hypothetical protein K1719_039858 [Acacia pycnantha]